MTRTIRTLVALLATLLLPMAARAADDKPAADDKAAAEAKPAEAPKPVASALPSVLSKFNVTFYGYVNFDAYYDTTRSYDWTTGNTAEKEHTQKGNRGRTVFSASNSRFGFRVAAPEFQRIKASAQIETDFGQVFPVSGVSSDGKAVGPNESTRYSQGLLRLRQANLKLETPIVDVLIGQSTYLLGWQTSFFPATVAGLGLPGEPFGRTPQIRLTKVIATPAVNVEVAAGAFRPPQRDAAIPELQAGARVLVNGFKGIHTLGAGGTGAYPAALALSGAYRQFKVSEPNSEVIYEEKNVTGGAVSVDTLIPIIPSWNGEKGNKLTFLGTFVLSRGASDLIGGMTGGGKGGMANGPTFPDGGQVLLDADGHGHAVDWKGLVLGLEYYIPPAGRCFVSATYSRAWSSNVDAYNDNTTGVYDLVQHWDGNVFFDVTPAVRLGASYQHRETRFVSGTNRRPHNDRYHFTAYYNF